MTTTFLIGNGLGMALDPEIFSLEEAMSSAWGKIEKEDKYNIANITGSSKSPKCENDLRNLQRVLWYMEEIESKTKESIESFFLKVVKNLYNKEKLQNPYKNLYESKFFTSLSTFILGTKETYVATLNYDPLLYSGFNKKGVFKDKLVDGFYKYEDKNLVWDQDKFPEDLAKKGWYLALHGSPMFITDKDKHIKLSTKKAGIGLEDTNIKLSTTKADIKKDTNIKNSIKHHLILTDPNFKKEIINKSPILKKYWEKFSYNINSDSTHHLVVVGYSGNDPHINQVIRDRTENDKKNITKEKLKITVIEWDFSPKDQTQTQDWFNEAKRKIFWMSKFQSENIELKAKENILGFDCSELKTTTP